LSIDPAISLGAVQELNVQYSNSPRLGTGNTRLLLSLEQRRIDYVHSPQAKDWRAGWV